MAREPSPAGDQRNKRSDGVRTLEDIRIRCVIDDLTGCWHWAGAMSVSKTRRIKPVSRVWLPEGLGNGRPAIVTASKAAWVLSGRPLPDGWVVWRSKCSSFDCVNPLHARAGRRVEMGADLAASGRMKGSPDRVAANARNRMRMVTPLEKVRQAEVMFKEGALQKEVRAALGLSAETARSIRLGMHPHSSVSQRLIRGASVFTLGAMA